MHHLVYRQQTSLYYADDVLIYIFFISVERWIFVSVSFIYVIDVIRIDPLQVFRSFITHSSFHLSTHGMQLYLWSWNLCRLLYASFMSAMIVLARWDGTCVCFITGRLPTNVLVPFTYLFWQFLWLSGVRGLKIKLHSLLIVHALAITVYTCYSISDIFLAYWHNQIMPSFSQSLLSTGWGWIWCKVFTNPCLIAVILLQW